MGSSYEEILEATLVAESLGFDAMFLPDHVLPNDQLQTDPVGRLERTAAAVRPRGPGDAWSIIAGLARETTSIRLGTMVTCALFRHPSALAVQVATINKMSHGRIDLGIGAGWFEVECEAYGFSFPSTVERFLRLEEQLRVIRALWDTPGGDVTTISGDYFRLKDAVPVDHDRVEPPRLLVGGSGPKKVPRLGATYADELNGHARYVEDCVAFFEEADRVCEELGRDPSTLRRSLQVFILCGEDDADIERQAHGVGHSAERIRERMFVGTPEQLVAYLRQFEDNGIDRVNLSRRLPVDVSSIRLIGEQVLPHFEKCNSAELKAPPTVHMDESTSRAAGNGLVNPTRGADRQGLFGGPSVGSRRIPN
jgi:alkanesulfonate monooxygenase SsuD/methylene tetrahydromethanopterin reductase-like flavin-dependent oxidoreductase (luciferase family)